MALPSSRLAGGDDPAGMVGDEALDDELDDDEHDDADDADDADPGGEGCRGKVWKLDKLRGFQLSSLIAFQTSDCCGWWCCTIMEPNHLPSGGGLFSQNEMRCCRWFFRLI